MQPAGGLAERGAQLDPRACQPFADILGALAQRLGALPHLARGLGGARTCVAECAFGLFGLLPSRLARLLKLELSCLPEALRAVLHLLEACLETRYELAAERGGVSLERGKLAAQSVEIALELRPLLVRFGFAWCRLISEFRWVLVFHVSPHSGGTGVKQGSRGADRTATDCASTLRSSQVRRELSRSIFAHDETASTLHASHIADASWPSVVSLAFWPLNKARPASIWAPKRDLAAARTILVLPGDPGRRRHSLVRFRLEVRDEAVDRGTVRNSLAVQEAWQRPAPRPQGARYRASRRSAQSGRMAGGKARWTFAS